MTTGWTLGASRRRGSSHRSSGAIQPPGHPPRRPRGCLLPARTTPATTAAPAAASAAPTAAAATPAGRGTGQGPPQTTLGPGGRDPRAGRPGCRRRRPGGVDRPLAASDRGARRLPGPAERRRSTDLAAGGFGQPRRPHPRTPGRAHHRRRRWRRPHRHHPADPRARVHLECAAGDGVDPPRFVRVDPRIRQRQDQCGLLDRRSATARTHSRTGHGAAARPLRRDRIRRVRRHRGRCRRDHDVPDGTGQRSPGRHRPAGWLLSS